VAAVLQRHTSVLVPAFGAATEEAPPPLDSSPLSRRSVPQTVIQVVEASDPQAATDVAESLVATAPSHDTGRETQRGRSAVLAVAALIAVAALAAVWSLRAPATASGTDARPAPKAAPPSPPALEPPAPRSLATPAQVAQTDETPAALPRRPVSARPRPSPKPVAPAAAPGLATSAHRGGLVDEPPF
jgi:hypothetical protein